MNPSAPKPSPFARLRNVAASCSILIASSVAAAPPDKVAVAVAKEPPFWGNPFISYLPDDAIVDWGLLARAHYETRQGACGGTRSLDRASGGPRCARAASWI